MRCTRGLNWAGIITGLAFTQGAWGQGAQPATAETVEPAQVLPSLAPTPSAETQATTVSPRSSTPAGNSAIEKLIESQPDWACQYDAHALTERHVVVACKEGSVLTLVRTPTGVQLVNRRETNGKVDAFYEQDGAVWMRVVEERAERVVPGAIISTDRAVRTVSASAPPVADAEPDVPVAAEGTVKVVNGREAVVQLADGHGVDVGQRIAMGRPAEGAQSFFVEGPVVAKVVRVMGDQVLVRVGMNEVVEPGFNAKVTQDRETGSRRVPPRVYGVWDLRTVLRPILNIGKVGGGVSGELGVARRTEYFRFGLNISPVSYVGATDEGSVFSAGGYVFGAVDHAIYSAGIGVGANTVNDTDGESESGSGLSIVQLLRIGAVDGLHFESRVEAVIFRSEVLFSYLQLQGQIAVADTAWLVVRGGGGSLGYGFGEVVVRNLLWGTGQAGSTFLELGLGGAGLFEQACVGAGCEPVVSAGTEIGVERDVGGPMFTAGLEWRL